MGPLANSGGASLPESKLSYGGGGLVGTEYPWIKKLIWNFYNAVMQVTDKHLSSWELRVHAVRLAGEGTILTPDYNHWLTFWIKYPTIFIWIRVRIRIRIRVRMFVNCDDRGGSWWRSRQTRINSFLIIFFRWPKKFFKIHKKLLDWKMNWRR